MSMLHVYSQEKSFVASINKQHRAADGYRADLPWLLLLNDGKIRRFPSMATARDEALKAFPGCRFSRT